MVWHFAQWRLRQELYEDGLMTGARALMQLARAECESMPGDPRRKVGQAERC
jgi:hypothetical protein